MRVSHVIGQLAAVLDDPNLVACGGLAPVVALTQRSGLAELNSDRLTLTAKGSANAHLKAPALIVGMVGGGGSIQYMNLLWHGWTDQLFGGCLEFRRTSVAAR